MSLFLWEDIFFIFNVWASKILYVLLEMHAREILLELMMYTCLDL